MRSAVARQMMLAVTLAAGLVGCGGHGGQSHTETTSSASARAVGANDFFAGRTVHTSGGLAGDGNSLQLRLHPKGGAGTRKLGVEISSSSCRGKRHCLLLAGKLSGTLIRKPGLPDVGRAFAISVSGTVRPLGWTSGTGTVTGIGNVRLGHELLRLTLNSRAGQIVVAAQSARVPGFTSP